MDGFEQQSENKQPPWKIIAMIVAGVVLVGIIIVVIMMILKARQSIRVETQALDRIETQLEQSLEGCAQEVDPAACRQKKIVDAAKATGAVSLCEKLEAIERDECIWKIARERKSPEMCVDIADEENRTTCSDTLYARKAIDEDDVSVCNEVVNDELKENCIGTIEGPLSTTNCAERGKSESFCQDLAMANQAIAAQDSSLCMQVIDEGERGRCEELIAPTNTDADGDGLDEEEELIHGSSDQRVDTDSDGLTDFQEVKTYKTDPANPDTDGDTYTDGSEVKNGYNPLGDGKLEE